MNENKTAEYSNEIRNWMNSGKDFNEGYLLFVRFSHNRAMALQFARKGAAMASKLEYELQKILDRGVIIDAPVMPVKSIVVAQVAAKEVTASEELIKHHAVKADLISGKINPAELPEPVKVLFDQNSEKHKLMRSLHEQMKLAKKDGDRAKLRKELVALDDLVSANWKTIDRYLETGELPETPKGPERLEGDSYKQINAARSYVSRGLNGLDKKTGKKRDETIAEIRKRFDFLVANKAEVKKETLEALQKIGIANEDPGNK